MSTREYIAPWPVFALAWSNHPSSSSSSSSSSSLSAYQHPRNSSSNSRYAPPSPSPLSRPNDDQQYSHSSSTPPAPDSSRIAIGSFVEQYTNRIQILGFDPNHPSSLQLLADASHPYPPTKLGFQPSTLSDASHNRSSSSERERTERGYASPITKLAKRGSWGAKAHGQGGSDQASPTPDNYPDRELLASSADCLRIWEVHRNDSAYGQDAYRSNYVGQAADSASKLPFSLREKSVLAHSKNTTSPPAPLTSFSWNTPSPNLIVTSSIDTTCTIWDLPTRTALTQLIAHDREVYDVDWCPGSADVFASVGADGSVRVFDLRSLEHSTIIYETGTAPGATESRPGTSLSTASSRAPSTRGGMPAAPLLRIAFNPWDANYLATFHLESDSVQILDVRAPGSPILELRGHSAPVNAIAWGPPSSGLGSLGPSKGMVCSAADDAQVLVYDLASTTLRTASAQGRRSRNGHAASPAPGSAMGYAPSTSSMAGSPGPASMAGSIGIGAEIPFLAYTCPSNDMVNNVAWLRAGGAGPHHGGGGGQRSVVQEWNDYTAAANGVNQWSGHAPPESDWIAMAAGNSVRALKV